MKMKRCKYCHKIVSEHLDFCSHDCEEMAKLYFERWNKYKFIFSVIIGGVLIFIIGQTIFFPEYVFVSKILVMIIGLTLFIFPFGNTVDSLGVKNTVMIIRGLSVILMIITIIFMNY